MAKKGNLNAIKSEFEIIKSGKYNFSLDDLLSTQSKFYEILGESGYSGGWFPQRFGQLNFKSFLIIISNNEIAQYILSIKEGLNQWSVENLKPWGKEGIGLIFKDFNNKKGLLYNNIDGATIDSNRKYESRLKMIYDYFITSPEEINKRQNAEKEEARKKLEEEIIENDKKFFDTYNKCIKFTDNIFSANKSDIQYHYQMFHPSFVGINSMSISDSENNTLMTKLLENNFEELIYRLVYYIYRVQGNIDILKKTNNAGFTLMDIAKKKSKRIVALLKKMGVK